MSATAGVVIVGGGPAGLATARAFRDAGGDGPVTILTTEDHPPYHRPPLTKDFLLGESGVDELPIEDEGWFSEHGVRLRTGVTATALDPVTRRITLAGGEDVAYDACVLATGAEPRRLPVPGGDDPGVLTMRRVEDARALQDHGRRVVVVGSGFVGCEAACHAGPPRRGGHGGHRRGRAPGRAAGSRRPVGTSPRGWRSAASPSWQVSSWAGSRATAGRGGSRPEAGPCWRPTPC